MIVINLSKRNALKLTTQYFANNQEIKPMIIPGCARCIGMYIFWKKESTEGSFYAITGVHIPPYSGKKEIRRARNSFFKLLKNQPLFKEYGVKPYYVFVAGGKIDTPINQTHYMRSLRFFVRPLYSVFDNIQIDGFMPMETTQKTNIFLRENGKVEIKQFVRVD